MCPYSSGEQSRRIDQLPEDTMMLFYSSQYLDAEIAYRQERIKRDFQRPLWFQKKPAPKATPQPVCRPAVQARHAM
ncbi:hypothetical protein EV138_4347 [Kribbella voronezhensis]|uniref:Uncharacterized protein n=1 Tax=Kribbella voronezhensis TaxID=2512212 RepID=A0A4R7TEV5_9ACTN|nr:hypothetical protein [Kribbella voronezhensis]TDU90752.1 hypothetical protein EV138_4347 [Kribbella voronezhensis]